jgi:NAD(P)-dependent dehydrogenase (short-subunit alcohol dehydrogenase family)
MRPSEEMEGKNILITGATAGIGLAAVEALAGKGAKVLGISRDPEKCLLVAEKVRQKTGNPDVFYLSANLASLAQVRQAAEDVLSRLPKIDILINNVGAIFYKRGETVDGFERTFALNHLSNFLFTNLLLDRILQSAPARIINVSSSAQFRGVIEFDDLQAKRKYRIMKAYGQSKLANMLFTYELDRRLEGKNVTVNAMHPGLVKTDIATNKNFLVRTVQRFILRNSRSPAKGAETIVYLASSPEVEGVSGKFFIDKKAVKSASASYNVEDASRLWSISESLTDSFSSPISA